MHAADVMVGNSSSGIIESASCDLPVVDVGPRQKRRQRGDNVRSVPHDQGAIKEAIDTALSSKSARQKARKSANPYNYGGAGRQIASFLEEVNISKRLLRKNITF
jgi:UDP-N-acetylglucosamine 2-epimerase (non-hydrolysing)/GDP/UDP-N,N'-diacetylbacillosamine 2-epimerase (hydrolysing)